MATPTVSTSGTEPAQEESSIRGAEHAEIEPSIQGAEHAVAELPSTPPTFDKEASNLIVVLYCLSNTAKKLVKQSQYPAPADPNVQVTSWKMNEFKYYDVPSPFPTLARGLFTSKIADKQYQIVVRGYDKFFNIGEVPWTTWDALKSNTTAPYTLSLKSNGCIIFIAALSPTKLIVTSKHSLGEVQGVARSHAQVGETWLRKYIKEKGKTEEELAGTLWENNWTAIAELCDDSFEEHVLAYPPEKTGLHLHGLNKRTKGFNTEPTTVVDAFAEEWGFIKTATIVLNTIDEVKKFTDHCSETGEWNGEAVEGFVVRTHVSERPNESIPYPSGSSFFFKVKFDEPYMMYRDWREVTKSLLSSYSKNPHSLAASSLPKSKMKRAETKVYVKWVIEEIKKDVHAFDGYTKGQGIIKTRERFLDWLEGEKGKKALASEEETGENEKGKGKEEESVEKMPFEKTIIVPVAIPGCGKTTIAVALAHIFGFGHTQSDDVKAKKAAPVFIQNVLNLLVKHDVVIADKNNHFRQHRASLREVTVSFSPPVRLLALDWSSSVTSVPRATSHRICTDRVLHRGENHQSLVADPTAARTHEEVLWMFINNLEELADSEVDATIEMELGESIEEAITRAAKGVAPILGLEVPSEEAIKEGMAKALGYQPKTKFKPTDAKSKGSKKANAEPRYFGLLPEIDVEKLLEPVLVPSNDPLREAQIQPMRDFFRNLQSDGRVIKRPHITIVHRNSLDIPAEKELWDTCMALHLSTTAAQPPMFEGKLGWVLCDGRVMAITLEDFGVASDGDGSSSSTTSEQSPALTFPSFLGERLHITVGTRTKDIAPVEAKAMVEQWKAGQMEEIYGVELRVQAEGTSNIEEARRVVVQGRVKGLMG